MVVNFDSYYVNCARQMRKEDMKKRLKNERPANVKVGLLGIEQNGRSRDYCAVFNDVIGIGGAHCKLIPYIRFTHAVSLTRVQ